MEPEDKYQVLPLIFGAVGELSQERRRAEGAVAKELSKPEGCECFVRLGLEEGLFGCSQKGFLFIYFLILCYSHTVIILSLDFYLCWKIHLVILCSQLKTIV